jgi:hypothetical protein
MRWTVVSLAALAVLLSGCNPGQDEPDREGLAREAAPAVKSFLATGVYVEVDGEPAVTLDSLTGPGTGAVQVLAGRSRPGAAERQCTALGVRLVPHGERGQELLPIVADGFESKFKTTCGIP